MDAPLAEDLRRDFAAEAWERLEHLEELLLDCRSASPAATGALLDGVRRELHTLKGNSGMMGLAELQATAHGMEDLTEGLGPGRPPQEADITALLAGVDRFRLLLTEAGLGGGTGAEVAISGLGHLELSSAEPALEAAAEAAGPAEGTAAASGLEAGDDLARAVAGQGGVLASVRIPFATLDALVDLLAEVVIFRNRLADSLERTRALRGGGTTQTAAWTEVDDAHQRLGGTLDSLQEGVLKLRMVPLRSLFRQLGRIVHDTGLQEGKEVRFETTGGETPLDKALLELASDALGHLVRNAVSHGIEGPDERRRAGKPERGTLRLSAVATAREVRIDVEDDGRGVQTEAVRVAAARGGRQLAPADDPLQLLFVPGVTTRRAADLVSGRGIGLAAVKQAVEQRGGRVDVVSREGEGSLFRLRLPLSASITRALLLRCDGEDYALPMRAVVESVRLQPGALHELNGAGVLRWRENLLPALDLGCGFGTAAGRRSHGYAVVIEDQGRGRAIVVDQVLGIREIVVKSLDQVVGAAPGVAGSTILGDGRAVLILDATGLLALSPFVEAVA